MAFQLNIIPKNNFQLIQIANPEKGIQVEISTKGGLLNSWKTTTGAPMEFIAGNDFDKGWVNFEMNGFRSGKMSPFSCRLENGAYQWGGQQYTIEKFFLGEHAIHGIVYDSLYEISHSQCLTNTASVTLTHQYLGTDKGFPFPYSIEIHWTINTDNKIKISTTITNHANNDIPIMDGWHPYFCLGGKVDEYKVTFNTMGKVEYDETLIPTGKINPFSEYNTGALIGAQALDDCFELAPDNKKVLLENDAYTLTIQAEQNYPYLQLYIPQDRNSIAIENLSGIPNCFNNKIGLQVLKPQASLTLVTSYQITVK
jgi:aldose 1-epimerase